MPSWSWAFDDGPGATIAKAEHGPVDGVIVGAVDSATTHFDYAGNRSLELDGTDDRVDLDGINITGGGNNAFTISAWVYSEDTAGDNKGTVFGNWFQGAGQALMLYEDDGNRTRLITEDGAGGVNHTGYADMPKGQWVHLVGVWDGSPTNDGFGAVYINGILATSTNTAGILKNLVDEQTYGIGGDSGTSSTERYFDGFIDEVAVWRSALSVEDVRWLYTNSMTRIPVPEPSTLILACLGALALLGRRRAGRLGR